MRIFFQILVWWLTKILNKIKIKGWDEVEEVIQITFFFSSSYNIPIFCTAILAILIFFQHQIVIL